MTAHTIEIGDPTGGSYAPLYGGVTYPWNSGDVVEPAVAAALSVAAPNGTRPTWSSVRMLWRGEGYNFYYPWPYDPNLVTPLLSTVGGALDFTRVDAHFDAVVAAGFTDVLVCIWGCPEALIETTTTNVNGVRRDGPDPTHVASGEWQRVVTAWVTHVRARYGASIVDTWRWEVWNEADHDQELFWNVTGDIGWVKFVAMYDATAAGIRAVIPTAKVGTCFAGPGDNMVEIMAALDAAGSTVDLFSVHEYSVSEHPHIVDLSGFDPVWSYPPGTVPAGGSYWTMSALELAVSEDGPTFDPSDVAQLAGIPAAAYFVWRASYMRRHHQNWRKIYSFEMLGSHMRYGFGQLGGFGEWWNGWWTTTSATELLARPGHRVQEWLTSSIVVGGQMRNVTITAKPKYLEAFTVEAGGVYYVFVASYFNPSDPAATPVTHDLTIQFGNGAEVAPTSRRWSLVDTYQSWVGMGRPGDLGLNPQDPGITPQQLAQLVAESQTVYTTPGWSGTSVHISLPPDTVYCIELRIASPPTPQGQGRARSGGRRQWPNTKRAVLRKLR